MRTLLLTLLLSLASSAEARTAIFDGSRGFSAGDGFDAYRTMEIFLSDRGVTVIRASQPLGTQDLSEVDLLFLTADWMVDGPHSEADREAIRDFVEGGGDLLVLADVPGPSTEALNLITEPLGISVGGASAGGGRVQVDEPAQVVATNRDSIPVMAVREGPGGVVFVVGARIWRDDLWDANRENVLRQTLGWLADSTPARSVTWGGLKHPSAPGVSSRLSVAP